MTTTGPIGFGGIQALYFELSQTEDELRKASRDTRHEAQRAQVEALYDKADHIQKQALYEGLGQIASGAGTIGSGACGIAGGTGALGTATADASAQMSAGSGKATEGIFSVIAGAEGADATRCDARAQSASMVADDAHEAEQDARNGQDRLARQAETLQGLQNEARNAALRA